MSDDMNAEQGDSGSRPENKPTVTIANQQGSNFKLAPETLSSVPTASIEDSTHPISRLRNAFMAVRDTGGAQRAGTQGRAGGTTVEGGRPPHRGIGRREFILGSAAIAVTAAALQEPRTGLIQRAVKALFGGGKKDGKTNSVASDPTKSDAGQPPARPTEAPTQPPSPTPEPTIAPEVLPFEIGVENDYGNFSLIVEKERMETSTVQIELLNGIKNERTVKGVKDWVVADEAVEAVGNFVENIKYRRWLRQNQIDPSTASFESFKEAEQNGSYQINGVEIPKKKVSFLLAANPQDKGIRTELTADQMWGLIKTPQRDIITIWLSYAADEQQPGRGTVSEGALLYAGGLYVIDALGRQTFIAINGSVFNENLTIQTEIFNDVYKDYAGDRLSRVTAIAAD